MRIAEEDNKASAESALGGPTSPPRPTYVPCGVGMPNGEWLPSSGGSLNHTALSNMQRWASAGATMGLEWARDYNPANPTEALPSWYSAVPYLGSPPSGPGGNCMAIGAGRSSRCGIGNSDPPERKARASTRLECATTRSRAMFLLRPRPGRYRVGTPRTAARSSRFHALMGVRKGAMHAVRRRLEVLHCVPHGGLLNLPHTRQPSRGSITFPQGGSSGGQHRGPKKAMLPPADNPSDWKREIVGNWRLRHVQADATRSG